MRGKMVPAQVLLSKHQKFKGADPETSQSSWFPVTATGSTVSFTSPPFQVNKTPQISPFERLLPQTASTFPSSSTDAPHKAAPMLPEGTADRRSNLEAASTPQRDRLRPTACCSSLSRRSGREEEASTFQDCSGSAAAHVPEQKTFPPPWRNAHVLSA